MDMESCLYEMATGIDLEIDVPTKTPDGMEWEMQGNKQRRGLMLLRVEASGNSQHPKECYS